MTAMSQSPALSVSQLTVNYEKTPVLWDLSFEVPSACIVGILGPNGAGKSTFLKTSLGLIKPLSGTVRFMGQDLSKVRKNIAYVPQKEMVDWDFPASVFDLVLMGRYGRLGLFRWPSRQDRKDAMKYIELLGMRKFAERQISQLSGGQQQRVFIARALMQEAELYLMDEPFVGVDMVTKKSIMELLQNLKKEGKSIFIVHHDLNSVREDFDRVIMLNTRLVAEGTLQDVYHSENIEKTFQNSAIFEEALRLSQNRTRGLK